MSCRSGETRLDSEYILNEEPAKFSDWLDMGCGERGVRMALFFCLSDRKDQGVIT